MKHIPFQSLSETSSLQEHLEMMKIYGECHSMVRENVEKVENIVLKSPFDAHLHVRDGEMLKLVGPSSATTFSGAIIMPNITPTIESVEAVLGYKKRIVEAIGGNIFEPFMTLNFRPDYTEKQLLDAKKHIIGIKMYPQGQTTNSERGVNGADIESYQQTLSLMQALEIPLLVHGERIDGGYMIDECDKERKFAPIYEKIAQNFPKLKIIMEHVSTKECIALLEKYENLFATVTLHHLLLIHNDVLSKGCKPHHYCMPIAKHWDDRKSLLQAVLSGNPKIMFGSDSAPHTLAKKENDCGCAGIFTAPIALQVLVEIFESFAQLANLEKFVSANAQQIYGIELPHKVIALKKSEFLVPNHMSEYVGRKELYTPAKLFLEGKKLAWDIV